MLITRGLENAIKSKRVTYDLARRGTGHREWRARPPGRGKLQAGRGSRRRVRQCRRGGHAGRHRRRLASGHRSDRPDRTGGESRSLRRGGHLGRDPASGRHAHGQDDRRDQQGQGRADLQDRRLRDRG